MAGNTKGTYRSKADGGQGVPVPPLINFAYLKAVWPETTHKEPHRGPGNVGATKSERRALLKAKLGIPHHGRLPIGTVVE
jgi:hypothetical protein